MKLMIATIAMGIGAMYFFTKNRKVDFELEIEPKHESGMSAADQNWLAAGAE